MDELLGLGFGLSYQSLTRNIRSRKLRPACQACKSVQQRPNAIIEHPPGEETQWDWLELPNPPAGWGARKALLLVGSLPHSGKWRAVLAPSMGQSHLFEAMIAVLGMLGGVSSGWRFDRMATVYDNSSGDVNTEFAAFAKHYGTQVAVCPPRSGHRKGVVEPGSPVHLNVHSVVFKELAARADLVELSLLCRSDIAEPLVKHFVACARAHAG